MKRLVAAILIGWIAVMLAGQAWQWFENRPMSPAARDRQLAIEKADRERMEAEIAARQPATRPTVAQSSVAHPQARARGLARGREIGAMMREKNLAVLNRAQAEAIAYDHSTTEPIPERVAFREGFVIGYFDAR